MTALDDLKEELTALQTELKELSKQVVIVGTIVPYGGESAPGDGWLKCDGRPLKRAEYPDLYRVIGTNFGAPDAERFNLPDLRGRFVRGVDDSTGMDPDAKGRKADKLGGNTGSKVGSVQEDAYRSHQHQYKTTAWFYSESKKGRSFLFGNSNANPVGLRQWVGNALHQGMTDPQDEKSKETRPKNINLNWIIYAGVLTP